MFACFVSRHRAGRWRAATALAEAARRTLAWWVRCCARAAQRRALAELDDRALRDVGITRGEALRESHKPFWRA